jgi:hypothetical protein
LAMMSSNDLFFKYVVGPISVGLAVSGLIASGLAAELAAPNRGFESVVADGAPNKGFVSVLDSVRGFASDLDSATPKKGLLSVLDSVEVAAAPNNGLDSVEVAAAPNNGLGTALDSVELAAPNNGLGSVVAPNRGFDVVSVEVAAANNGFAAVVDVAEPNSEGLPSVVVEATPPNTGLAASVDCVSGWVPNKLLDSPEPVAPNNGVASEVDAVVEEAPPNKGFVEVVEVPPNSGFPSEPEEVRAPVPNSELESVLEVILRPNTGFNSELVVPVEDAVAPNNGGVLEADAAPKGGLGSAAGVVEAPNSDFASEDSVEPLEVTAEPNNVLEVAGFEAAPNSG